MLIALLIVEFIILCFVLSMLLQINVIFWVNNSYVYA
jgi:hypothetical protein